jgi:hypothetical protein
MSDLKVMPPPAEKPLLRSKKYREKYDFGPTTFWKLRREKRIDVYQADGLIYVVDQPPRPKS